MQPMHSNIKNSLSIKEFLDWIQILFRKNILILLPQLRIFKPQASFIQRGLITCSAGNFPYMVALRGWLRCDVTWAVLALSLFGWGAWDVSGRRGAGLAQRWARQAVCGNSSLPGLCSQAGRQGHRGCVCVSVCPAGAGRAPPGEHQLLVPSGAPCEDPRSAHSRPRSLMLEQGEGPVPVLGAGQAGAGGAARSCLAAFGLLLGEPCALCCSSSAAEGSVAALPVLLTAQQSKHGPNSACRDW